MGVPGHHTSARSFFHLVDAACATPEQLQYRRLVRAGPGMVIATSTKVKTLGDWRIIYVRFPETCILPLVDELSRSKSNFVTCILCQSRCRCGQPIVFPGS